MRDPETEKHVVDRIFKPGPTVLVSTSTKPLGHQLVTCVFSLEINDGTEHIREARNTQAELELAEALEPNGGLIAYQDICNLVYELVGQMYETTITGAFQSIRDVVQAVERLGMEEVTVVDVAKRLGLNKSTAWRRVKAAIRHG